MKIQIISDLHQEFGVSELSFDNADLVVIASEFVGKMLNTNFTM